LDSRAGNAAASIGLDRFLKGGLLTACTSGIAASVLGRGWIAGELFVLALAILALQMQRSQHWKTFAFAFWVLAFVLQAFCSPSVFQNWPGGSANAYVFPLIQIIMFGMGTTLSLGDFSRVLLIPHSIGIGMLLQFTVMPAMGWLLARAFGFSPEVAAGVVLIGACPGGVASNVIAYLARGDVALSVTMTACSTLLSPIMTPLAMWLLVGSDLDVSFQKMMWSILTLTIAPIFAGLALNYTLQWLNRRGPWLDRAMSSLAMLAICVVIGIIVAQSRDALLQVGAALVMVAVLHNALGYACGYFGAKACRLSESSCRTIAIEVGMQNGGMATALATTVLNSPPAALAGAIFGPWMSVSGSVLASWWSHQSERDSGRERPFVAS
jgi:bile acid:Na+ symporter, BASS family